MHIRGLSRPLPRRGFTLIELLVVIAIIAILAVVVVLTLNPAELLRQSRDSSRLSDLATLTSAINLYNTDQSGVSTYSLGSVSTTYISVPDPNATSTAGDQCQGLGMSTSTPYHCEASTTYRTIASSGWIPINFSKITSGSPIGSLPVDPTNQTSSGLYYSYATNGSTFELTALPESQKDTVLDESNTSMFIAGSNTSLLTAAQIANGSVAQSNMKLSVASNTAFVDFGVGGSLTPYIGDELIITDSTGHQLTGYIKAAGTGETYGGQLLANTAFNNTSSIVVWQSTIASVAGGQSGNALQVTGAASSGNGAEFFTMSYGALLLFTSYVKLGTTPAWSAGIAIQENGGGYSYLNPVYVGSTSWMQYSTYTTADMTSLDGVFFNNGNGLTSFFDTASITQVLTPSATGVTIVSSSGGSSQNWTSQNPSFNLNDPSGYTYSIVL